MGIRRMIYNRRPPPTNHHQSSLFVSHRTPALNLHGRFSSMSTTPAFNPYEAPKTKDFLAANADQITYDGKTLMIPKHYTFPPVCLKTGAIDDLTPQRRRKLSWYPPLLIILLFINILIFAIIAACFSKKGEIYFQLSREVARKRRNTILRNWGLFAFSLALGIIAVGSESGGLGLAAIAMLLITIGFSIAASRFLSAKRVDKTHIWLCGVSDSVARALVVTQGRSVPV
jgi:hypothetical protein